MFANCSRTGRRPCGPTRLNTTHMLTDRQTAPPAAPLTWSYRNYSIIMIHIVTQLSVITLYSSYTITTHHHTSPWLSSHLKLPYGFFHPKPLLPPKTDLTNQSDIITQQLTNLWYRCRSSRIATNQYTPPQTYPIHCRPVRYNQASQQHHITLYRRIPA